MNMFFGDFTNLATKYNNRPAYNQSLLDFISNTVTPKSNKKYYVADVGAGKSTVGTEVVRILRNKGEYVVYLDGDELREIDDISNAYQLYLELIDIPVWKGMGTENQDSIIETIIAYRRGI